MESSIVILGLGPGAVDSLSVGALEKLKSARKILLRTGRHPVADDLAGLGLQFETFDHLYEQFTDFDEVYQAIAAQVIAAAENGPLVFAVPGHPLVGEESVVKLIEKARDNGIKFEIIPGMSFLDPVLTCLGADISRGLKFLDGTGLTRSKPLPASRPDTRVANLIMQVYSNLVASDIKLTLMDYYPDEHPVTVVRGAGIPGQQLVVEVPLYEMDRLDWIDHLTCVYVPPCPEARSMVSRFPADSLVDIMEQLRGPEGCPWDQEQTHKSLTRYMVEETYEVLDAIDEGNMYKVCEELGDLLLQIAFHAEIARESGFFDLNDVIEVISQKLIRRHPHVFGSTSVSSSDEVTVNWDEIKKEELKEKGEIRQSLLDGIPRGMPALMKADKIQRKAAKVGFDWPDYSGALDKVLEEIAEVKDAISENKHEQVKDEMGDLLFAVVNLARLLRIDLEEALEATNRKFKERFSFMEEKAAQAHTGLDKMDLNELDRLWEEAKIRLNQQKNKDFVIKN